MKNILINLINNGIVDSYIDLENREKLIDIIKGIKEKYLYHSLFHGLHHSEKVLLFAYMLGINYDLSKIDMQILIDAAIYHDIGRFDETEDAFHGLNSARKIEKVVDSEIYQDEQNLAILKAICDGHSRNDKYINLVADDYGITEENLNRYQLLYKILKDADALDRTRFMKTSTAVLNEKFLRFPFSKQLVEFANIINQNYRIKMSDIHYEQLKNFNNEHQCLTCYHGIGFNFFNLYSILKNGLLSNYAKLKKGIYNKRNFYGANNELWICVTTKDGKANKKFIKDFISLQLSVPRLQQGEKIKSKALSDGLPYDNGYYDDEAFAFYEVPVENIKSINISPKILNTSISELNYLSGSYNLDSLLSIINDYLNNIRMLGYFPDINNFIEIFSLYKKEVLKYEGLNEYEQRSQQKLFFDTCDKYVEKLNSEVQKWMQQVFEKKFNKKNITVKEIVDDILNNLNIKYTFDNGTFILSQGRQL